MENELPATKEEPQTWIMSKNWFKEPCIKYPWKINGKVNWKNLIIGGSWESAIGWLLFILLVLGSVWAYNHDVSYYKSVTECYRISPSAAVNYTAYEKCQGIEKDYEIGIGLKDANGNYINDTNRLENELIKGT